MHISSFEEKSTSKMTNLNISGPMWQPGNGNLPPAGPYSAPTDPTTGLPPYGGAQDWQSQPTSGESSAGSRNTQPDPWGAQQWGTDPQMFHPSI